MLLSTTLAAVLVFADPVSHAYGYPLLALAAIVSFAFFAGRRVAPMVLAATIVLAVVPTAGVAQPFGRNNDAEMTGECHAPIAAFFVRDKGVGGTEAGTLQPAAGPTSPAVPVAVKGLGGCGRLGGRRLATALGLAMVGALLAAEASRRSATGFRVRNHH